MYSYCTAPTQLSGSWCVVWLSHLLAPWRILVSRLTRLCCSLQQLLRRAAHRLVRFLQPEPSLVTASARLARLLAPAVAKVRLVGRVARKAAVHGSAGAAKQATKWVLVLPPPGRVLVLRPVVPVTLAPVEERPQHRPQEAVGVLAGVVVAAGRLIAIDLAVGQVVRGRARPVGLPPTPPLWAHRLRAVACLRVAPQLVVHPLRHQGQARGRRAREREARGARGTRGTWRLERRVACRVGHRSWGWRHPATHHRVKMRRLGSWYGMARACGCLGCRVCLRVDARVTYLLCCVVRTQALLASAAVPSPSSKPQRPANGQPNAGGSVRVYTIAELLRIGDRVKASRPRNNLVPIQMYVQCRMHPDVCFRLTFDCHGIALLCGTCVCFVCVRVCVCVCVCV